MEVAIKLARKAYVKKHRLMIFTRDAHTLATLDRMMWVSPPTGFLPHCNAAHKLASETAIVLSAEANLDSAPMPHHDILMNLDHERPAHFSRFERVLEIVSRDDADDRAHARERLKFYRDRGYAIGTVDLNTLVEKEAS
jgi:DNA polymerase-3 subunit chi